MVVKVTVSEERAPQNHFNDVDESKKSNLFKEVKIAPTESSSSKGNSHWQTRPTIR